MLSTLLRRFRVTSIAILFSLSVLVPALHAQHMQHEPGVPASVTSHGFGGYFGGAPGVPASVTSHGSFAPNRFAPNRFAPNRPVGGSFGCCVSPIFHRHHGTARFEHRSRRDFFPGTVVYGVPYYPFAYADAYDDMDYQGAPAQMQNAYSDQYGSESGERGDQYGSGPTVFDRNGAGPEYPAQSDRVNEQPPEPDHTSAESNPQPEPLQPPTILVFKDGHQVEVSNYAIVGDTIFDFTPGHPRRVALSELNVQATQKQNDNRGVDFRLPAGPQGE